MVYRALINLEGCISIIMTGCFVSGKSNTFIEATHKKIRQVLVITCEINNRLLLWIFIIQLDTNDYIHPIRF
jgi:hypothetical protein